MQRGSAVDTTADFSISTAATSIASLRLTIPTPGSNRSRDAVGQQS